MVGHVQSFMSRVIYASLIFLSKSYNSGLI